MAQAPGLQLLPVASAGWTATPPAMMPGQILDPSVTADSLSGLGPLTAEELKYADIHNIGAMIAPVHFLEVKLGKRPQSVKSELDKEEERRKRCWEKNKVMAARCQNKKKERKEFLQQEFQWLELMNAELKTQVEELRQERKKLILMLNQHHPTCITRTDSIKTPHSEANPLLEQPEKKRPGMEKDTVPGPAVPTYHGPAQSCLEWQSEPTVTSPTAVAVGTRHGYPSKSHSH
ncbi:LOW QUALITY PROTEIN: jun dimerization protein 2-like [Pipistrellus kuhlii]|uniref:LOW QUALITY PROTEIN: jun dimerization protein 2-like n=1 Tax=Pipistrellus kuhlii TaxID=59472 RepID=UPI001E271A52|nr:LOW QUALITY PROTEIN: jun dimerization protein 2-like [Pipistrellus kuhlii]